MKRVSFPKDSTRYMISIILSKKLGWNNKCLTATAKIRYLPIRLLKSVKMQDRRLSVIALNFLIKAKAAHSIFALTGILRRKQCLYLIVRIKNIHFTLLIRCIEKTAIINNGSTIQNKWKVWLKKGKYSCSVVVLTTSTILNTTREPKFTSKKSYCRIMCLSILLMIKFNVFNPINFKCFDE